MSSSSAAVTAAEPKRARKYWTPEEDKKLIDCVREYGAKNWDEIARKSGLSRTGGSCRMRWKDHKQPGINREKFTKDEDGKIRKLLKVYGKNAWSKIALKLDRRNGNQVKNYWNTHLSKKIPVSNEEEQIEISDNFSQCDDLLESSKKIPVSIEEELIKISGNFSQYADDLESSKKILMSNEKELIGISGNFSQYDDLLESTKKISVSDEKELTGISGNFSQYDGLLESLKKIPMSNEEELIEISGNFSQCDDLLEEFIRSLENENIRGDGFHPEIELGGIDLEIE